MKKSTWLFLFAFLCGVIGANVLGIASGRELGAMNEYFMNRYRYAEIQGRELFLYLFYQRVPEFFVLLLLSIGICGIIVVQGYLCYICFSVGFMSVISIMNYGIKGILLMAGLIFPQWICYLFLLFLWYYGLRAYRRREKEYVPENKKRRNRMQYMLLFVIGFFVLCGGIFLESYVNPFLLQRMIRIM